MFIAENELATRREGDETNGEKSQQHEQPERWKNHDTQTDGGGMDHSRPTSIKLDPEWKRAAGEWEGER